jgi:hypothetical protein
MNATITIKTAGGNFLKGSHQMSKIRAVVSLFEGETHRLTSFDEVGHI